MTFIELTDWPAICAVLAAFAFMFAAGYFCRAVMAWHDRRTIRQLREQASEDSAWICQLREQIDPLESQAIHDAARMDELQDDLAAAELRNPVSGGNN